MQAKIEVLKGYITSYPNFPKPGILFRDMFSILKDPKAFQDLKDVMVEYTKKHIPDVEVIVGLESRGFLFGTVLAIELGLPFVPIRKQGKLPGDVGRVTYELEYGTDTFEIQKSSINPGQNVLLVDDLIATGGSLRAACKLLAENGGKIAGCLVVMELTELNGRDNVGYPIHALLDF